MNKIYIHAISNPDKLAVFSVKLANGSHSLHRTYAFKGMTINQIYATAMMFGFMAVCNDDPVQVHVDHDWCSSILEKDDNGKWLKNSTAKYINHLRSSAPAEFEIVEPSGEDAQTVKISAELKLEALEETNE